MATLSQVLDSPQERLRQRPIKYIQVSVESIQQQLAAFGTTPDVQKELGQLFRTLGDSNGVYATARTPEAFTPTTFEQFVKNRHFPISNGLDKKSRGLL